MNQDFSDVEVEEAMQSCASEPVHVPGRIQNIGVLLAYDQHDDCVSYISDNAERVLERPPLDILGLDVAEVLGSEIRHAIRNVLSYSGQEREIVGNYQINGNDVEVSAFQSESHVVVELELTKREDAPTAEMMRIIEKLTKKIATSVSPAELFDLTVSLLRHLSGYDRVMVYRFDHEFNGEVVAEDRSRAMEPFLNLRFPHWDIPSQARDLMKLVPLRFINNTEDTEARIQTINPFAQPLDITHSHLRGVSQIHMQYLRNMGVRATMTLSIVVEGRLWGMLSFHHRTPRVPPLRLREVLTQFLIVFAAKLTILNQTQTMNLIQSMDEGKERILAEINDDTELDEAFNEFAPVLMKIFKGVGVAYMTGSQSLTFGRTPGQAVLQNLLGISTGKPSEVVAFDDLASSFPNIVTDLNGTAGALVATTAPNRAIAVFREEKSKRIRWAGNPDKTITQVAGNLRLEPRGSFSTYLQSVKGRCAPWTDQDHFFARRLWAILYTSERRALMNRERRQQELMIDELNHRVRNILTLVQSVSRQTRKRYSSLESYSKSLEARIQALAAAHDIGSGAARTEVSINEIISKEVQPYSDAENGRVMVVGDDAHIIAELAPIFALVVHELVTNAVKYGALKVENGTVEVKLAIQNQGLNISWREFGGPKVIQPDEFGFGTALIEQAVPHEMGGSAILRYPVEGLQADFWLPGEVLAEALVSKVNETHTAVFNEPGTDIRAVQSFTGTVMLVEDNFLIAADMVDVLEGLGFDAVETIRDENDAIANIRHQAPDVAVLDVNLGNGRTSAPIALALASQNIPFIFVTGYGEKADVPAEVSNVPILTKPVSSEVLGDVLSRVLIETS